MFPDVAVGSTTVGLIVAAGVVANGFVDAVAWVDVSVYVSDVLTVVGPVVSPVDCKASSVLKILSKESFPSANR